MTNKTFLCKADQPGVELLLLVCIEAGQLHPPSSLESSRHLHGKPCHPVLCHQARQPRHQVGRQ